MNEHEEMQRALERFSIARPLLQRALDYSDGTHTMDDIERGVLQGYMQLWLTDDYAGITEVVDYPKKRMVLVRLVAGKLDALLGDHGDLMQFAKIVGAEGIELFGRRGWVRALKDQGWEEMDVHVVRRVK